MIKAVLDIAGRRTLILGLSRENTVRLHQGKPALVLVDELLAAADLGGSLVLDPVVQVIVMAGDTEASITAVLAETFGALPDPPP